MIYGIMHVTVRLMGFKGGLRSRSGCDDRWSFLESFDPFLALSNVDEAYHDVSG